MIKTTNPPIRALGIILMFLLSLGIKAQTPNTALLTWDQEVGCIKYDDDANEIPGNGEAPPQTHVNLFENMMDGNCPRFCEDSMVTFTLQGSTIASVQWQATGGTLQPGSTNNSAAVQWGGSGNGSLTVTITFTDNTVKTYTVCIEKILSPHAEFQIDGPNPYQQVFCANNPISFNNISHDNGGSSLVNYLWDFGDGNFSNAFEPTHTYASGGSYNIRLTVTNSCNCSSTYEYHIKVQDAKPIEITCLNVTCEYSHETYTASDSCGSGDWEVVGGSIVGGGSGSTSVSVVWDQVDPEDGFGYISYRSHCGCPHWTTVKIPVVLHRAIIKGPHVICQGKQGKFTLPQWPTTDFKWTIDGDPNHPMLVFTDQRNEVMVDALSPGSYVITADYHNTLLGSDACRGTTKFHFNVEENVSILSKEPRTVCIGATNNFASSNGQPVNWQISLNNTIVHTANAVSTSYTFNTGGTYVVTANNNGCISDPVVVNVIPTPVITGSISGPNKVCLNVPYLYSISENEPGAIYVWSATGGTIIGSNAGTEVAAMFTSSGGAVHVVKQYVKNGVICQSDAVSYKVSQVVVSPTIVNNEGLSQFCASDSYTFTADFGGVEVDHMEWQIVGTPPGAPETTNFGSIIGGIHGTTVTVGINEITGGVINGELRLKVTKCGNPYTFTYPINLLQLPNLSFVTDKNEYCPGSNAAITITAGPASGNFKVFINGNQVGAPIGYLINVPVSVPGLFSNPTDNNVQQNLTIEYDGVCKFNPKASKSVIVFPETRVTLSSPQQSKRICPGIETKLYATVSIGITQTTEFYWYNIISPTPVASGIGLPFDQYIVTTPGTYYVKVIDKNGCEAISDTVTYVGCSDPDPGPGDGGPIGTPCGTDPNPGLTLTATMTGCNTFTANLTGLTSGTIRWYGSEHISTSSTGTMATYTASELGFHWIKVEVDYGSCSTVREVMVTNYYEAGLKAKVSCDVNGNYTVILENNSRVHNPGAISINYGYFEGMNSLGTGPGSITLPSVAPGIHTYTIKVSSPNLPAGVICEKSITLNLPAKPNVNFTITPTTYCSEDPVLLQIQDFNQLNTYEWEFGGTSFKTNQQNTLINFADGGPKSITLKATGPYGCEYITATPVIIQINKAEFFGDLNATTLDFCEGTAVTPLQFNANAGTVTPSDAIWMRDNVQVATGLTFTPTESGSYWPVLIDPNHGCKFYGMAVSPVIVTVRKPPFASINGNTSVCYGESTTLAGIYTDPAVQHRWTGPSLPAGYNNWVTGATNLTLTLSGLAAGNHTYTFETRHPSDPNCVNSFNAIVVFHPQLTTPSIGYNVVNCQPYTLQLTASGPAAGTYTWSNGMVGQTIQVTHGGAYSVTYTAPTGCSVTAQVQAPHNPERSLWIVPQGCYKICANLNPYLLAPLGVYQQYRWFVNGSIAQMGNNTFVPNKMVNQSGDYQLAITQFGCTFYSNKPHIDLSYGCRAGSKPSQVNEVTTPAQLTVSPNPATEVAVAAFNVGSQYQNATAIAVYDVTGVQRLQQKVSGKQGEVQLNVGYLPAGTYLVNLQADGVNIAQQKLIKR